ncbi:4Fe-4S binding protein [bacterium]|nr:4Fe-4S binding protein [bacterium]
MPATVDKDKCNGCGLCVEVCLAEAIVLNFPKELRIETEECLECRACENECPNDAITVIQRSESTSFTKKSLHMNPSATKESPAEFIPPIAVPSDESLIREIVPNTDIFVNQTFFESLEREVPRLIREKIAALWEILDSVIRRALSSTSQSRNAQERISGSTSRIRGWHRHRHSGGV